MIQTSPFGKGQFVQLQSTNPVPLSQALSVAPKTLLKQAGAVLFRGFDVDLESFSSFVSQLSSRLDEDSLRQHFAKGVQKVDAGLDSVGLHCENGKDLATPDLCWFYCAKAATTGSQTTLCDGYRVWDALSEDSQNAFKQANIKYCRTLPPSIWKNYIFHERPQYRLNHPDEVGLSHLEQFHADIENLEWRLNDDLSLYTEHYAPAAHPTLFGERLAFANNIFSPSFNVGKPQTLWANSDPLSPAIIQEITRLTEEMTEQVEWQDNDVVLIDNSRVMHGRRKIVDENRLIYNAISYL